jgi:hypothetical protein
MGTTDVTVQDHLDPYDPCSYQDMEECEGGPPPDDRDSE